MKTQVRDLLILIDDSESAQKAINSLTFVPPLRVERLRSLPDPSVLPEEPLLYLLGDVDDLKEPEALTRWLESLYVADAAPVALLVPRQETTWCRVVGHQQICGLLPGRAQIEMEEMERILQEARQVQARRWGHGSVRRAKMAWSFSSLEASDPEQAWLLMESVLSGLVGPSADLSCLGMAFAEGLTNAVEHGNLELESTLKEDNDDGLLRFFEERERRLADRRYSRRRVHVSVTLKGTEIRIRIANQGRGFDPQSIAPPDVGAEDATCHGLGLTMIKSLVDSVTIAPDGRSITLCHHLPRIRLRPSRFLPSVIQTDLVRRPAA